MNQTNKIIEIIENNSIRPMENRELIRNYIRRSINENKLITFYNWECPPRVISQDKTGEIYINYDVNYNKIFKGQKLDEFTEIPRVVEESTREIRILEFLKSTGLNFRFVKLVADTNAYYITPNSLEIIGKNRTKKIFKNFQSRIEKIIQKSYPQPARVYLFSELMKSSRKKYEESFRQALKEQKENGNNLISPGIWQEQLERTRRHMGIGDKDFLVDFSQRVVATYGAEGIIFDLLSGTNNFSNPVWLNIEEVDERTVAITNCLRKKKNIGKLPMIFLK